jgi:hypothetical protein
MPDFLLVLQKKLFQQLHPTITITIETVNDKTLLIAKNVTEEDFKNITLITNSPEYQTYMYLVDIKVTLAPNNIPNTDYMYIYGLYDFVNSLTERSDTLAFVNRQQTHQPYLNGFGDKKLSIGELIDNLTEMSVSLPNTFMIPKLFTLIFDPPVPSIDAIDLKPRLLQK